MDKPNKQYTPRHNVSRTLPGMDAAPEKVTPRRQRSTQKVSFRPIILAVVVLAVIGFSIWFFVSSHSKPAATEQTPAPTPAIEETTVSFVAVGDNLPEISIGTYGDANAGELGDGLYDYRPIYEPLKPYIEAADLAYISFETHAGGDAIGPRGWPSFNTTSAMVDAVADTGFDLIASASNHCYDWGFDALAHSASLWAQKEVLFTGTAVDEESAATIRTIERNGIVFSMLNYTYGVNGYAESDIPAYAVNYMHEDRIATDIAAAREISDVVIVAMHWGTENYTGADDTQLYYAQLIADSGADVVLGSHPHVIGPVRWIEGSSGNKTLVAFSLGNFLSCHEYPEQLNELGGMLSCDFVKNQEGVSIENVSWTPLVNHTDGTITQIYRLKDYTNELAAVHRMYKNYEDPLNWLYATTVEVVGPDINIVN